MVYAVLVDGAIDAIWETEAQAKREQKDLIKMDCGKVTIKKFETELAAYEWADKRG